MPSTVRALRPDDIEAAEALADASEHAPYMTADITSLVPSHFVYERDGEILARITVHMLPVIGGLLIKPGQDRRFIIAKLMRHIEQEIGASAKQIEAFNALMAEQAKRQGQPFEPPPVEPPTMLITVSLDDPAARHWVEILAKAGWQPIRGRDRFFMKQATISTEDKS